MKFRLDKASYTSSYIALCVPRVPKTRVVRNEQNAFKCSRRSEGIPRKDVSNLPLGNLPVAGGISPGATSC